MELVTPEDLGFSSQRLSRISATIQGYIDQGKIAGTVTLIARHGKIAHFEALGYMDIESGKPMQLDSIHRIASMTKLVTVVSVMMLYEEGHFLLDDPISQFIPEFAQTKVFVGETDQGFEVTDLQRPITIRHLLMHMSGLPYGNPSGTPVEKAFDREQIGRPDELLEHQVRRIAHLPLAHQPGSAWTYGYSHDVLGRMVEVISGMSLDVFFARRLFEPLGMVDTGFYVPAPSLGRLAEVHAPSVQGRLERLDRPVLDAPQRIKLSGGGGLVSTAADYARLCQMLLNGGHLDGAQVLGRTTIDLMTANQMSGEDTPFQADIPLPGRPAGWRMALGVATVVDMAKNGVPLSVGSYSWMGAWGTVFWIDPTEDLFGVLMVQQGSGSFWGRPMGIFPGLAYQALVG